jgi:hypothetical protein
MSSLAEQGEALARQIEDKHIYEETAQWQFRLFVIRALALLLVKASR